MKLHDGTSDMRAVWERLADIHRESYLGAALLVLDRTEPCSAFGDSSE